MNHPEVELILVPICRLPLQRFDTFLFGVIVLRPEHVVLVFLEDPKLGPVSQLRSFFVVSSVKGVP